MPRSWGNIYPKLTKKAKRPKYDPLVATIQALPESKRQYTRILSSQNIDKYVLRIGAPPRLERVLAPPSPIGMAEEGDNDDSDDDGGDNVIETPVGGRSS